MFVDDKIVHALYNEHGVDCVREKYDSNLYI